MTQMIQMTQWRRFRSIWLGASVSMLGDQVTLFAVPTIAIVVLSASSFETGLIMALGLLTYPLLGLIVGAWTDRVRRRPLIIASATARMVLLGLLAVATASGYLTIWLLIVTVMLASACGIVSEVALQSYLPGIVAPERLTDANARMETSRAVAQISGPGLGGLLIQALGPAAALASDSLSFVPLITTVARADERRRIGDERSRQRHIIEQVRDGVRFMRADGLLWRLPAAAALSNLGLQLFRISFLLFAYRVLGFSAGQAGLALTAAGAGAVVGSIMTPRAASQFGQRRLLVRAVLLEPLLLLPIAGLSGIGDRLQIACVLFFLSGVFGSPWNIISKSLRMARTPDEMQGRVNAAARTIALTGTALGALLGGVAVTLFSKLLSPSSGPQASILVGVAVACIGIGLIRKQELYEPPSWSESHRVPGTASQ